MNQVCIWWIFKVPLLLCPGEGTPWRGYFCSPMWVCAWVHALGSPQVGNFQVSLRILKNRFWPGLIFSQRSNNVLHMSDIDSRLFRICSTCSSCMMLHNSVIVCADILSRIGDMSDESMVTCSLKTEMFDESFSLLHSLCSP